MNSLYDRCTKLSVKLKLKDDETRLIRGYSLVRSGSGSYDERAYARLTDLAIKYAQGDDFDINATNADFILKTTYIDRDGDVITFSTKEEFNEAVHQIPCGKTLVLRVSACVQKKSSIIADEKAKNDVDTDTFKNDLDELKKDLQKMKDGLDHQEKNSIEVKECKDALNEVKQQNEEFKERLERMRASKMAMKRAMRRLHMAHKNRKAEEMTKKSERNSPSDTEIESKEKNHTLNAPTSNACDSSSTSPQASPKQNNEKVFGNPYPKRIELRKQAKSQTLKSHMKKASVRNIAECHRGIRCDGCDMLPIVGIRYHATNLPDYDLCEKCHKGMKGTDISFSIVRPTNRRCKNKFVETSPPLANKIETNKTFKPDFGETFPALAKKAETNKALKPDFIHGRHTCDGCMKSPIVGLRYHALNIKDYDLCSECYAKTKGDDIVFEAQELDRDRNRQEIWERKLEKRSKLTKNVEPQPKEMKDMKEKMQVSFIAQAAEDLFYDGTENTVRRLEGGHTSKHVLLMEQDFATFFHSFCSTYKLRQNDLEFSFAGNLKNKDTPTSVQMKDGDVLVVTMKKVETKVTEFTKNAMSLSSNESSEPSQEAKKNASIKTENVELPIDDNPSSHSFEESPSSSRKDPEAIAFDEVAQSKVPLTSQPQIDTGCPWFLPNSTFSLDEHKDVDAHADSANENKNQEVADDAEDIEVFNVNTRPSEITTSSTLKDSLSEIEFSQGSTEVDEKEVTDEEKHLSGNIADFSINKDEEKHEVDNDAEKEGEESIKDDTDLVSSGSADEWDMIDEEDDQLKSDETLSRAAQLIGSSLFEGEENGDMQNDEMLARATQLIGSALFEEDNSKSDSFYSLPSTNTNIPLAQMTRWHNELITLRELGFVDDKNSILCLEELQAANIGVDSDEPVQIENVVDRLLQNM